jgi:tRNA(adenine34) deaminase
MDVALAEARKAADIGEVPVGAVVVRQGELLARGFNRRETWKDPSAHAEYIAIRRAAEQLGRWRLVDCDLYVTLEPCLMCAGLIVNARIPAVYYGASDPKAGAVRTLYAALEDPRLNHRVDVKPGVSEEECGDILTEFFEEIRDTSE